MSTEMRSTSGSGVEGQMRPVSVISARYEPRQSFGDGTSQPAVWDVTLSCGHTKFIDVRRKSVRPTRAFCMLCNPPTHCADCGKKFRKGDTVVEVSFTKAVDRTCLRKRIAAGDL